MAEVDELEDPAVTRALQSAARAHAFLGATSKGDAVVVKVRPASRGRATGWSLSCPKHGPMPVLLPSRAAGIKAGKAHLKLDHGGVGEVDVIVSSAGTKPAKRKKRRR